MLEVKIKSSRLCLLSNFQHIKDKHLIKQQLRTKHFKVKFAATDNVY